jgi:alpha-L-fucosidase
MDGWPRNRRRISSGRTSISSGKAARVTLLGSSVGLEWKANGNGFVVSIPERLRANAPCRYAWTIKVSKLR